MVGGELTEDGKIEDQPVSCIEIFDQMFPYYLSIGMTYDQYWKDDPNLVIAYRKAFDIQRRNKNQELWMQGYYVYNAICSVAPILVSQPKRDAHIDKYMEEPCPITQSEIEEYKERKAKERADKIRSYMMRR